MISATSFSFSKFVVSSCLLWHRSNDGFFRALWRSAEGGGAPTGPEPAASDAKAGADAKPATRAEASGNAGDGVDGAAAAADAHVEQTIQMDGKTLHYTATVGTLAVRDSKGALSGEVVYTAYIDGRQGPAGDVCVQRRTGCGFGLFEPWRDWAEEGGVWRGGATVRRTRRC